MSNSLLEPRVVRLRVSYDGRDFYGSQRQAKARTVQEELERATEEVAGNFRPIYLAGRTDRGVHAAGQVASFAADGLRVPVNRLGKALNAHLPIDVAVLDVAAAPIGFHARYSAVWREYRYRVWCGTRQPLAEGVTWQQPAILDTAAMGTAAERLVGEHNFAAFASGSEGIPGSARSSRRHGTMRIVTVCELREVPNWWGALPHDGALIEFRIVANGYLPKMVRGIMGTLAEIGRGNRPTEFVDELLVVRDRRKASKNAPADGLTLWAVGYGNDLPTRD